jgi:hypothetical protein
MSAVERRFFQVFLFLLLLTGISGIASAVQSSAGSNDSQVTIVGRLELAGKNYFTDPKFILVDDQNNPTPIAGWAPLEIPPPPPGAPRNYTQPLTMRDFLGRRLSVTGVRRESVRRSDPANFQAISGDNLLEVNSVVDIVTGMQLYTTDATAAAVESNTNAVQQIAPLPSEAQKPMGGNILPAEDRLPATDAAPPEPLPVESQRPASP